MIDQYADATVGLAFFRVLATKVLSIKTKKMEELGCTKKYSKGFDWNSAFAADYAEKCPRRLQAVSNGGQLPLKRECKEWPFCAIALEYRRIANNTKEMKVDVQLHLSITEAIEQVYRDIIDGSPAGSDEDTEIMAYAAQLLVASKGSEMSLAPFIQEAKTLYIDEE